VLHVKVVGEHVPVTQVAGLAGSQARQVAAAAVAPATQNGVVGVSAQPSPVAGSHGTHVAVAGLQNVLRQVEADGDVGAGSHAAQCPFCAPDRAQRGAAADAGNIAQRLSAVAPLAASHAAHMPPMHNGVAGVSAHCASCEHPAMQVEVVRLQTGVAAGQLASEMHCPQTLPGAQ
jgi:hypothetical protein